MSKSTLILVLAVSPVLLLPSDVSAAGIRRNYRVGGLRQRYRRDTTFGGVMSARPRHPWSPPIGRREFTRAFGSRNPRRRTYAQTSRRTYQPPPQLITEPPSRRDYAAPTVEPPGTESPEPPVRPRSLRPLPGPLQPQELIPEPTPQPNE